MVREGKLLAQIHPEIVVKIPLTPAGIAATKQLSDEGIQTNVTLCFQANQALLAAKAGATYISPFLGRLDDVSQQGVGLIEELFKSTTTMDMKQRFWLRVFVIRNIWSMWLLLVPMLLRFHFPYCKRCLSIL